jgi:hypothetical protein
MNTIWHIVALTYCNTRSCRPVISKALDCYTNQDRTRQPVISKAPSCLSNRDRTRQPVISKAPSCLSNRDRTRQPVISNELSCLANRDSCRASEKSGIPAPTIRRISPSPLVAKFPGQWYNISGSYRERLALLKEHRYATPKRD